MTKQDTNQEPKLVLVVDDEPSVLALLKDLIADAGYDVMSAVNAEQAIDILSREPIGVAIVDKNLPGEFSGLDVLRESRRVCPFCRVILHTGYPSQSSAISALQDGAFDYLGKPAENDLIIEKIRRAFEAYKTERSRAELLHNYETLFETVPGLVWFMARDGVIKRVSTQGAAMLGYSPQELVGTPSMQLHDPASITENTKWVFSERRRGVRATRRAVSRLVCKDGTRRVFEISSAGAYRHERGGEDEPKELHGTLAVGWDITEHAELLEELQETQRMDALGRLAGGVAHDFNNLLSVIINDVDFICDTIDPQHEAQTDLAEIRQIGLRAAELTNQLLVFSRNEVIEPKVMLVTDVLNAARRILERLITEDVSLSCGHDEDIGYIKAGPTQIQQVIINLVVNARDAMPNGGEIKIHVSSVELDSTFVQLNPRFQVGRHTLLTISDTGVGMSREQRTRIFEPFYSTKAETHGTGLGMAIVYGIVRQSRGVIQVESELNQGSTIKVFFPEVPPEAPDGMKIDAPTPGGGTETLLLVEDEATVRRVARRILTRAGYTVLEAANGAEATTIWQAHREDIALVVTDVVMPNESGPQMATRLREERPSLPVIFMSGYLGRSETTEPLLTDNAVFIAKPFSPEALLTNIRQLIDEQA